MSGNDGTALAIAEDIERYLFEHPSASDTAAGIQSCWLSAEWRSASVATVEAALTALERNGIVERREVLGGSVIFSARRH
jgi:Fe2+ or Zn2+ uptake regulation protein